VWIIAGKLVDWSITARTLSGSLGPGAVVTPVSGLVTSEAGGTASFTVKLDSQPGASVTIPVSSSDATEGSVSTASLTFTAANWNIPQLVTVSSVDDVLVDGTIAYTIVLGASTSTDPDFAGINPADVSVSNLDNDVPPTKFYVVNDASANRTYEYGSTGSAIENYTLNSGNTAPRGAASTAAGDKVWVVDANRNVYVYNTSGGLLGSWTAGTLPSNATVEGIATNGTDVWIVDARTDRVYRYTGAASLTSGSQNAASSFALNSSNTSPKDVVTDGTHLWVVNDASSNRVFKYTVAGQLVGSWTINGPNSTPTGITIDPSNVSDIWIVDSGTDRVYHYPGATTRTSGSASAASSFALAAGNTNPQGIADPPTPPTVGRQRDLSSHSLLAATLPLTDLVGSRAEFLQPSLRTKMASQFAATRHDHAFDLLGVEPYERQEKRLARPIVIDDEPRVAFGDVSADEDPAAVDVVFESAFGAAGADGGSQPA
jgi:hypothetical protein